MQEASNKAPASNLLCKNAIRENDQNFLQRNGVIIDPCKPALMGPLARLGKGKGKDFVSAD
jgi:hypothetical protein